MPPTKLPTVVTGGARARNPHVTRGGPTDKAIGAKSETSKLPSLVNPSSPAKNNKKKATAEDEKEKGKEKEKESAKAIADEEATRQKAKEDEEEREKEKARLQAEEAERKLKGNGNVKLIYERYDEEFSIVDGICTAAEIDDVYCLSFVMPNCLIHLSIYSPQIKREKDSEIYDRSQDIEKLQTEVEASDTSDKRKEEIQIELEACWEIVKQELYIKEEPQGTFHGLERDMTYYVYVEQEADQLARDQEKMRMIAIEMEGHHTNDSNTNKTDFGDHGDTCTCIYGTPCTDEEGCRNWKQRFVIAEKNGSIKQAMSDDLREGKVIPMF